MDHFFLHLSYKDLFYAVPDRYLILAKDFKILEVSDAYLQATKTIRHEILGRVIFDVFPDNPNHSEADGVQNLKASLLRVINAKITDTMPVQRYDIPDPQGHRFLVRYWSPMNIPILDDKGEVLYIIHRAEDVTDFIQLQQKGQQQKKEHEELKTLTERIEAEVYTRAQEISEANQKLNAAHTELSKMYAKSKELDQLKMNFFANINHELRTPLTLILGPTKKLLNAKTRTEEERHDLHVIERNAQLLLKQVNDLLDIAKLDAGQMTLAFTKMDVCVFVKQLASNFEFFAKEQNIDFVLDLPKSLYVEADASKLHDIMLNLLSNAFKFTPVGGSIKIALKKEKEMVQFHVIDSGPGIPPAMKDVIFERFRQIDGSTTRYQGGTGLGLSIVKEFVTLHGGTITVENSVSGGAKFVFNLPLKAPAGTKIMSENLEKSAEKSMVFVHELTSNRPKETAKEVLSKSKGRVLVVEDNVAMNAFISSILSSNYTIENAYNGREGLEKALHILPDLIISDVMMPHMDGEEMARSLLEHPETKHIPLLILTAKVDDALKLDLLKEGVHDYINKPFSAEELHIKVNNLLLERRKKIIEHEHLMRQLKRSNQELERFAYAAAHDLQTPLRAIYNLSQWIEEDLGTLRGASKDYMIKLRYQVLFMEKLLNNVLEYSLIDHQSPKKDQQVNIKDLVKEIMNRVDPLQKFHIIFKNATKEIRAEKIPLQQVLYYLINNAINHHHKECGTIEINLEQDKTHYIFHVKDDGPGIAKEYHEKIFDLFQKLKTSTESTGVGLALVKKIVTTYGGQIMIDSEIKRGCTFQFTWKKNAL